MRAAHYSASLVAQSAARRLQMALRDVGVDAYSVVQTGAVDDIRELSQSVWGKFARRAGRKLESKVLSGYYGMPPDSLWSSCTFGTPAGKAERFDCPDILHLHWIAGGALNIASIARLSVPVVWTMHDTWPFTAGCHILNGCEKYQTGCEQCSLFPCKKMINYAAYQFRKKKQAYTEIGFTAVSPSRAYQEKAHKSALLRGVDIRHIPNCIDTELFRPIDRKIARQILRLPEADTLILFGAVSIADRHKGMDLALDALHRITADKGAGGLSCVCFGGGKLAHMDDWPCRVINLGRIADQTTLALAYSAADVFVCPSREDNLPNTVFESLACGTPVVAFSVGGIPEMVDHGVSGYLATPQDAEELAKGIGLLLRDADLRCRMGQAGREKVEREFSFRVIGERYRSLYEEILENHARKSG